MKKLLSVSVASLAFASIAAYTPTSVGVTEITPTSVNTIVPAPYQSLADGESIAVQDLVKAANLPDGTMLYFYNGSAFNAWIRGTGENVGKWIGSSITSKDGITVSPGSSTVKLTVGSALWVIISDEPTTRKIYIYGKPSEVTTTTVTAGSTALVANPRQTSVIPTINNPANGDVIGFVDGTTYTYNTTKGKWGSRVKSGTSLPTWQDFTFEALPFGSGFWYTSKGSTNVTINWGE